MDQKIRILIAEDSEIDAELVTRELGKGDFAPAAKWVKSREEFIQALGEYAPDLILCDYKMPGFGAPVALKTVRDLSPETPLIVVSGIMGEDVAVEMMKSGAVDYVMKDRLSRLVPAIKRALKEAQEHRKLKRAEEELARLKEIQFRTLIESLPGKVFLKDRNSVYICCNASYAQDLGIRPEEIEGKVDYVFFPTHLAEKFRAEDKHVMESGEVKNEEEEYSTVGDYLGNAQTSFINTVRVPIRDDAGNVTGVLGFFWDITGRKEAEKILRASEAKYRALVETTKTGYLILNAEGKVLDANPEYVRLTGCRDLGDILGRSVVEWTSELDKEKNAAAIVQCLRDGFIRDLTIDYVDGEGRIIPVEINATVVGTGESLQVISLCRDISERKRAAKALLESEQRCMDVLYAARDAILLIDGETFVDCNEATARMLGYATRKEFLMKHPSELSPLIQPDGRKSLEKANEMMKLALERGFHRFEWIHRKANGEDFPVEVSLTPISIKGKTILHCLWRDITERKRTEDSLKESRALIESTLNSITDIFYAFDLRGKFLIWNETFGRICGYSDQELSSKKLKDFFLGEDIQRVVEAVERIFKEGSAKVEANFVIKNGKQIPFEFTGSILKDGKGHIIGFSGTGRDLSERKVAEAESRRVDLLKTHAEIKSKFASMVSHELRSPLSIIHASISLIHDGLSGPVNQEQKKVLETGLKGVERLGRLINNVLDFQKIESGKREYDMCDHDIKATVEEACQSLRFLSEPKGLDLRVKLGELLPVIKFDKDGIIQVLTNLVSNSIKFISQGSVTISVQQENNEIHVEIRDTGPGIRAEDIPRLFQPFEQLDHGRSRAKGGTGLGLAISKEIVLAHGGRIWAESEIGKGSVFHFTLPVQEHRRPA
ncbi:MAG: PAS domain S-box protein [Candidatus Omnitrophota bacterium]